MKKNAISIGSLLGYAFMASIPISLMLFDGNRLSVGGVLLHELILIAILLYLIWMIALKTMSINFIFLDWIAILYVFFALIPVLLSIDNLYLGARDYRHLFLVPLIAYLLLPFLFSDVQHITNAFLFFIPGLLIGNLSLLPEFLRTGIRPQIPNLITIGLLSSWSAVLAFIVRKGSSKIRYKIFIYLTTFMMLLFMSFSVSRGVLLAFLITFFLSIFIFKKKIYQKIFIFSFIAILMIFYLSLSAVSEASLRTSSILSEEYREMRRSVYRLATVDYYFDDFKNRMYLWKKAYNLGLERPILGRGAFWYRNLGPSTPHNIFVAVFLTSGCVGMLLFILLIINAYTTIFSLARVETFKGLTKFLFISFTVLLIVGASNDFSGGRYLLFFVLLSGIATAKKIQKKDIS
jgi:hypothetical protein